ncbi:putative disease resistance RPP13-like protein 1 [Cannabis sativa]|uniref:putative disease resistance RPP13-like protein 1 n=1 Tax=Cannabis sativa TaxID=3483 RepID=UPI0029CA8FA4|nr:putative disease resistance RPP13-like protein 1 [Cannabis sativa]
MDKISTEALRLKVEKDELESTTTKYLGLKRVDPKTSLHRSDAPLLDDSQVYGRDGDKEAILKLLLCDNDASSRISVIPIVGMGRIGKTTLITKLILEKITGERRETKELHQIQKGLKEALAGKKFLFVHDDVWNENYELWDLLKSSFQSGIQGSKIIVTTRNEDVALKMKTRDVQTYKLKNMSDDECWMLFREHAFDNVGSKEVALSELQEIRRHIVKKCMGLPLAVKSMAGLLRSMSTPDQWRHVHQSDMWELPNSHNIEIIPALWLSYRFLPPYLKPCFSYLWIFPKVYKFGEFDREKLFLIWMAEDLIQPQKGKRIEDVGKDYLNALITRSFFQRNTRNLSLFMHDLAMYVSGQCCYFYDSCKDLDKPSSKTRHLSYMKDLKDTIEFDNIARVKYLRTLLALPLSTSYRICQTRFIGEILVYDGGCLRELSLSESDIEELPNSIRNLKHLRYLDLCATKVKELPTSVCVLYNLETLLLNKCYKLTQLPTNISKLINLRHLVIRKTPLKEMPPRICNMMNLQTLSDFVLCENDGCRIKELGKLESNLHGSFKILGLQYVEEVSDVWEGELKKKKNLSELTLRWDGKADDSIKEREVLNALQPHENLKKLKIRDYNGTKLPDSWIEIFPCLKEIFLEHCRNINAALPICTFPSLEDIIIRDCDELGFYPKANSHNQGGVTKVADLILDNGDWNIALLQTLFDSNSIANIIKGGRPSGLGKDKWIWTKEANGHFTTKSAYLLQALERDLDCVVAPTRWNKLWNSKILERHKVKKRWNTFSYIAASRTIFDDLPLGEFIRCLSLVPGSGIGLHLSGTESREEWILTDCSYYVSCLFEPVVAVVSPSWSPPPVDWIKIKCDVKVGCNSMCVAALARDHSGTVLWVAAKLIDFVDPLIGKTEACQLALESAVGKMLGFVP